MFAFKSPCKSSWYLDVDLLVFLRMILTLTTIYNRMSSIKAIFPSSGVSPQARAFRLLSEEGDVFRGAGQRQWCTTNTLADLVNSLSGL